jgi:hypothetical protein
MDYTILLQGRLEKRTMDFWVKNYSNSNICVSIWEDDIEYNFPKKWTIVKSKKPNPRLTEHYNLDLQILSTLYGLEKIKTNYVIKFRCDEYWSNIHLIMNMCYAEPDKIICGSLFFKKIGMHPFAISDHIIAGKYENIKIMFESALSNLKNNFWNYKNPESQLGLAYLWNRESILSEKIENINVYDSDHPDPTPFDSNLAKTIIYEKIKNIELFCNRIKNDLSYDTAFWKNVKKWRQIIEYSVNDIERILQKSEYPNINETQLLKKHFNIIDVNLLKPFLATANMDSGRVWFESEFDGYLCITNID